MVGKCAKCTGIPPRVYDRVIDADGTVRLDENGDPVSITHNELFAITVDENLNVTWQAVCDSFGKVLFGGMLSGQFNGQIRPDAGFRYQWSSEGLDLFAYGSVLDLRDIYVLENDGTTTLDFTKGTTSDAFFRVDAAGGGLTLGQSVDAGSMGEITIVDTDIREYFQMAPDAQSIVSDVMEFDPAQNGFIRTLVLYDPLHENLLASGPREIEEQFRWSPLSDKSEIAFTSSEEGKYGIWLIQAAFGGFGESSPLYLFNDPKDPNSPPWNISDPRWSPDAAHLIFRQKLTTKGQSSEIHLYRIKSDGTGVVNLTTNLGGASRKWPFRWVSNQFAP